MTEYIINAALKPEYMLFPAAAVRTIWAAFKL